MRGAAQALGTPVMTRTVTIITCILGRMFIIQVMPPARVLKLLCHPNAMAGAPTAPKLGRRQRQTLAPTWPRGTATCYSGCTVFTMQWAPVNACTSNAESVCTCPANCMPHPATQARGARVLAEGADRKRTP